VSSIYRYIFALFLLLPLACVEAPKPVFKADEPRPAGTITVMTYNLENLFDTEHDPLKHDETFLPLAKKDESIKALCRIHNKEGYRREECLTKDWRDEYLDMKLQRLTDVLKQVNDGHGPDVLIMEEVENRGVLELWRKKYLQSFGYKPALLIEGPDERGIDVGMFTRLEPIDPLNLHTLTFKENANLPASEIHATRGILEANLKLPDGTLLTILGVHLPSQGAPSEMRRQALEQVNKVKAGLPADRMVIVGGDFNISSDEEARTGMVKKEMAKTWGVSHVLGCEGCQGTYYYPRDKAWSFFDIFLISPNMLPEGKGTWKILPKSIHLETRSRYQISRYDSPARFDEDRKSGVSDHFPLVMDIIKR